MCGITAIFHAKSKISAEKFVFSSLKIMKARGKDAQKIVSWNTNSKNSTKNTSDTGSFHAVGHNLHAMVGMVKQPIQYENCTLIANCEIYNWKEIDQKYQLYAKNDADVIIKLFASKSKDEIVQLCNEFDGTYAFCFINHKEQFVFVARDILGVKPLWYSATDALAFASEKKALLQNKLFDVIEFHPRSFGVYDLTTKSMTLIPREFFSIMPEHSDSFEILCQKTKELLITAVKKRIPKQRPGVLFSGGIDSVVIAYLLKKGGKNPLCYVAGLADSAMEIPDDIIYAKKAAEILGLELRVITKNLKQTEKYIQKIVPLIETADIVKLGVALPFFIASEAAKKDSIRVLFSGLGSEEIFAGYERHEKSANINNECISGLRQMHERDLYRDDVVTMAHTIELRLPFLDRELIKYALKIPDKYKITGEHKKYILRVIAKELGIPDEFVWRKKKAAQYGSKFDRGIKKLAHQKGYHLRSEYVNSLTKFKNLNVGVLWSTGKDSCYAVYLMQRHNYHLSCLLSIQSKNQDSYMFHTPNITLASLHAESMNLPLLVADTNGNKEDELIDLRKLLVEAKKKYNIEGVVTGALFSQYQRERIEKVADLVGLKVFSPLWHKNQEEYMQELLQEDFSFMLSSIAADGLDKSWVGRVLDEKDITKLITLSKKFGINPAGEGGEFESLVIDCPLFKKRIVIDKAELYEDGKHIAKFLIKKAHVEDK